MTTDEIKQLLEKRRDKVRDPSLHFRPECEGFRCGAHKSWSEGHDSLVPIVLKLVEALEFYAGTDCYAVVCSDGTVDGFSEEVPGTKARQALKEFIDEVSK